jgi:HSP20 family protein
MLLRFDPFREFDRLTREGGAAGRTHVMAMDAYRQGDQFVVRFDLPGVDPSSIDLTVERDVLTVSAERRWVREDGQQALFAERSQGTFRRQLFLGEALDTSRIEASYDNGVLTVTVPVAETAKPRKVAVSSGDGHKVIEPTAAA